MAPSCTSPGPPPLEEPQIHFTRRLWQRTMPGGSDSDRSSGRKCVTIGDNISEVQYTATSPSVATESRSPDEAIPTDSPLSPLGSVALAGIRKRSLDQVDEKHLQGSPDDTDFQICLCQPEEHIKRPRNVFILYRQHHNASVVARNPNLANPGVSKIIGELWRNEPESEKNKWKRFAEEEKVRHQEKYPNYRYQPKRTARQNSVSDSVTSSWVDLRKCATCGGRSLAQPRTPLSAAQATSKETSPTFSSPTAHRGMLPAPVPSPTTTPSTRYLPLLNNLSLDSPYGRMMAQSRSTASYGPQQPASGDIGGPMPDPKRRRYTENAASTDASPSRPIMHRQGNGPGTPYPYATFSRTSPQRVYHHPGQGTMRRASLPRADEMMRAPPPPYSGAHPSMGPPPRPRMGYAQHRVSSGRPSGHDLSVVLPPLQPINVAHRPDMATYTGPLQSAGLTPHTRINDVQRTPEALPFLAKIETLGQVAAKLPPIMESGVRTAVIAVEGDDPAAAKELADWLGGCLGADKDMNLTVMDGPTGPPAAVQDQGNSKMDALFDSAKQWHAKSRSIHELIASNATASQPLASVERDAQAEGEQGHGDNHRSGVVGPRRLSADSDAMFSDTSSPVLVTPVTAIHSPARKSVLLLRTYSLTACNAYASSIDFGDAYNTHEHWKWTACLWRGIIGPDLTIYIQDAEAGDHSLNNVTMRHDFKTMIVRRVARELVVDREDGNGGGSVASADGVGGLEAGALRRLGFEVGEWIRGFCTRL